MKWATRSECHVDRAACAWLIRRYIDPDPRFVFVDDPDEAPPDATPFDMRGADLSHHRGDCTFETMLQRFGLDDPVLWDVARIICRGLSMVRTDDEVIALTGPMFDGLYEYRRRALTMGREPS